MHVQTHLMAGWCIANALPGLGKRQRLFCMIAAAAPDLDGLAIVGGWNSYAEWRHVLGHNLTFALVSSLILALLSPRKIWSFAVYVMQFHLHLLMDVFGSGPGWGIAYYWPFSRWEFDNRKLSWEFYSWQNISIAGVLFLWTIAIAYWKRRTPLEAVMPNLDRQLVASLPARAGTDQHQVTNNI